jgi:predicted ATPase/DNA-binding SARP family transcriptional activator
VAALKLFLLGGFRVLDNERPLPGLESPRLQTLIARLVLNAGSPQPRQQLAFIFWPDSTEQQARTNLRQLLHSLRRAMPNYEQYIVDQGSVIIWREDTPFFLDVHQFRAAVQRAHSAQELAAAIELYRGDLLPNNYDDSLVPERERLRIEFSDLVERAINQAEAEGDLGSALRYVQRLIEHDPLREEVYRTLMRLSALRGERTGVIRAYRACVATWERELGVEPSDETRELYERLRTESVSPRGLSTPDAVPVTPAEPSARRAWIPSPITPLIGRERETGAIASLLNDPAVRLVTLTGVGGIGKTRVALQVADSMRERFADGVWFVDLASINVPELVPPTVARTLDLRHDHTQPALDAVKAFIADKRLLMVLDNFEQVRDAAPDIAELLTSSPGLQLMATSRAPLRIRGEREYPIPPLALPDDRDDDIAEHATHYAAVRLFVERAQAVQPSFRLTDSTALAVVGICRRLDGLPLAIELAAARIRALSPVELLGRLDRRLDILTSGGRDLPSRQQTLRRTIDWSYQSLNLVEQTLFGRLAVFSGGCTLEGIEAVCAASDASNEPALDVLDVVASLVENSLLQRDGGGEGASHPGQPRFRMLETIREYAGERLASSGQEDSVRRRHASYFTTLAEREEPMLWGGTEQATSLTRLDAEYDNLRTALAWSLSGGESAIGVRLTAALGQFWFIRGESAEGSAWLERAAAAVATDETTHAIVLNHLGGIAIQQGLHARAVPRLEQSLVIFRSRNDDRWTALTLFRLGQARRFLGDWEPAIANFEESLTISTSFDSPERSVRGLALVHLGVLLMEHGDAARGENLLNEALLLGRRLNDDVAVGSALVGLGWAAHYAGHDERAAGLLDDGLTIFRAMRHYSGSSDALVGLGWIGLARGETVHARQWLRECLRVAYERGGMSHVADSLAALAAVAGSERPNGDGDARLRMAAQLFGAAERLRETAGPPFFPSTAIREQSIASARAHLDAALWDAAWESGRARTTAEAVALALSDTSS